MNTPPLAGPGRHRRKIRYVDESLQKFLLIGLVALETALAAGLAWMMYWRLSRVVEDNLYRVHLGDSTAMLPPLIHETIVILTIFAAANLVAVLLVEIAWRRQVHSITRLLGQLMDKTYRLDFSPEPKLGETHRVLELAEMQRDQDRLRLAAIRQQLSRLEAEAAGTIDASRVEAVLTALDERVPRPAASA